MDNINRFIDDPSLKDLLDLHKKEIFRDFNCHAIGIIESFDSSSQTCIAKMAYSKTYYERQQDGSYSPRSVNYPILSECPVIVLRGGSSGITFPVKKGDNCLVLFNDRDIDNWFSGATSGPVNSFRMHSFTDAIILVGLSSKSNPIANYDDSNVDLFNDNTHIKVKNNSISIYNDNESLGPLLKDLTDELKSLIDQVALITVTCASAGNPSSVPINASAITAIKSQIAITASKLEDLIT